MKTNIQEYLLSSQKPLPFEKANFLNQTKQNLFKDLSCNYGGYKEMDQKDLPKFFEKLKSYGVKIKDLSFIMDAWSKMNGGFPFCGISVGPYVEVGKKHQESTAVHEALHVMQYSENAPIKWLANDLKVMFGFISFGIIQQRKIIKKMKKERKKYGKHVATQYATKNVPFEFEAYFHEGDTDYLTKRKPFAYKQYETKEGRSQAVMERMDQEILQRAEYIKDFLDTLETKKDLSIDDREKINILIEDFKKETQKILEIKEKYGNGDWEVLSTFWTPKGPIMWLESEINRNKRFEILDNLLEREEKFLKIIKQQKNVKLHSKVKDVKEDGIILLQAKDKDNQKLYNDLQNNKEILDLQPNIKIENIKIKQGSKEFIRVSFTKITTSLL